MMDFTIEIYIILAIVIPITKQQCHCFPFLVVSKYNYHYGGSYINVMNNHVI